MRLDSGKTLREGSRFRSGGLRTDVLAIGTAVFLFGFGSALWAGYQAHSMAHDDLVPNPEFDAYQDWVIIGMMIASVGVGIAAHELVFENYENNAGKIPKFAIVIGTAISVYGFGTMCWAGAASLHIGEEEIYGVIGIRGFIVGSLGLAMAIYGFASNSETHARKKPRIHLQPPLRQPAYCPYCDIPLVPGASKCAGCGHPVQKRRR
jgi:hypothetical protein